MIRCYRVDNDGVMIENIMIVSGIGGPVGNVSIYAAHRIQQSQSCVMPFGGFQKSFLHMPRPFRGSARTTAPCGREGLTLMVAHKGGANKALPGERGGKRGVADGNKKSSRQRYRGTPVKWRNIGEVVQRISVVLYGPQWERRFQNDCFGYVQRRKRLEFL